MCSIWSALSVSVLLKPFNSIYFTIRTHNRSKVQLFLIVVSCDECVNCSFFRDIDLTLECVRSQHFILQKRRINELSCVSSTDLTNFLTPIQPLTSIIGQIKHLLSCELIVHHPLNNFLTESKTEVDSG